MIKKEEVIEWLSNQSVLEISGLVKDLEEKWGVSAAAPVAVAAAPVNGGSNSVSGGESEGGKTSFDVVLKDVGANKIAVIKEVRTITGLGLVDAKKLVESAPQTVKAGVNKTEADEMKSKLEAAGAKIELK